MTVDRRHAGLLALENIGKAIELAAGVDSPAPHPAMVELLMEEAKRWATQARAFGAYDDGHTGELSALAEIGQLLLKYGEAVKRQHAKYFGSTVFYARFVPEYQNCRTCEAVDCQVYRTSYELLESVLEEDAGR